ncbi:MAG: ABC transporter ATP-binding protein [Marinobacter sp.]|uniref:ABC transporter ATP-binding protein n=1 Tax=Marinobacter sp. TaxID=50741 RepID=UPI00299EC1CF|nr:ABC transporter ATP-binding protein [Marinobacter sp.]MDX1633969.1 ABC transporter ATP-binding protein [Marinobacter sp.]
MTTLTTDTLVIDIPGRGDGYGLDLSLAPGQVWGILGPNGAGKSTLMHTLAGLRAPRSGRIRLDGQALWALSRRQVAQQLGLLFQDHHDGFPATVLETALIGRHPFLSPWQSETADDLLRARAALASLGLEALEPRLVSTLSGGERQRVALATLLTQDPAIWLVDEPTNHLDLHHQVEVMALLAERARRGRTVVMCLHDLNLAARWCDHLLLLYPNGDACWGEAGQMLVPEALERLYGQALQTLDMDGVPVFMPKA